VRNLDTGDLISESISAVNVSEHLYFTLPTTAHYQIEVLYFGDLFDTTGLLDREDYGLAWSAVAVPEPASMLLLLAGGLVLGRRTRRAA
jgi:hypothetical protein